MDEMIVLAAHLALVLLGFVCGCVVGRFLTLMEDAE